MAFAGEHKSITVQVALSGSKAVDSLLIGFFFSEDTWSVILLLVKLSVTAELVIHKQNLACLMQQQEILLGNRAMRSISGKLGKLETV